uniref:Uncharacterized protein n=1 Tax=Populus trichocarpa TaxID=3694 RepID=A0A2K1YZR5_POPTR
MTYLQCDEFFSCLVHQYTFTPSPTPSFSDFESASFRRARMTSNSSLTSTYSSFTPFNSFTSFASNASNLSTTRLTADSCHFLYCVFLPHHSIFS